MRKVILFNMMTLDGFFEGPNSDINWHQVDEEFNDFAIKQLNTADGIIFGRVTYEGMASYWPTPIAIEDDPEITNKMNAIPKFVFSRTLDKADWNNTTLVKGDAAEELSKIKQQPGNDLFVFGSADLAASFSEHGLIDEYRIMLNPVVIGKGTPLFKNVKDQINLKLLNTRTFGNGNVLLTYEPAGKGS